MATAMSSKDEQELKKHVEKLQKLNKKLKAVITTGFLPISCGHVDFDGAKVESGEALYKANHVEVITENVYEDSPSEIIGHCVAETSVRSEYIVRLLLDDDRSVTDARYCKKFVHF